MRSSVSCIALAAVLGWAAQAQAHTPAAVAYAVPLTKIHIDGQLDDWPAEICWHAVAYRQTGTGSNEVDPASLDPNPDSSARFAVAWDPVDSLVYVAVEARDDTVAATQQDFSHTDACEVLIEGAHLGKPVTSWQSAGDSPALVYVMWPPGGSYGPGMLSADTAASPNLMGGDIARTRTRGAWRQDRGVCIYEWALEAYDHYPDARTRLEPGKCLGFDIFSVDYDRPTEPSTWRTWAGFGAAKRMNTNLLGDLVLVGSAADLGLLEGRMVGAAADARVAELRLEAYRDTTAAGMAFTDADGRFRMPLPPGTYSVRLPGGQGYLPSVLASVELVAAQTAAAELALAHVPVPQALRESAAVYAALRTYSDTTTIEVHMVRPGMDNRMTATNALCLARPNRLRQEGGAAPGMETTVVCDGQTLTTYQGMLKQYTQVPAPDTLTLAALQTSMSSLGGVATAFATAQLLFSRDPLAEAMKNVEDVRDLGVELWNGTPVRALVFVQPTTSLAGGMVPPGMGAGTTEIRLLIGEQDHLVRQASFALDMDLLARSLPAEQQAMLAGIRIEVTERHTGIQVDAELADSLFVYAPPADTRLVTAFGPPEAQPAEGLTRKPAPAFTLKDLDGREVTLSDFAGRVVLVDFWATWCGPCRTQLPAFDAWYRQYEAQGFTVIGIAVDDSIESVRGFLREHPLSYPMVMVDARVREAYGNVAAIPTTFLIDRKGVIRDTSMGLADPVALQQQIEELLKE